jgi:hypothetical protein
VNGEEQIVRTELQGHVFVNNKLSQSDHFKSEPLLESEFP